MPNFEFNIKHTDISPLGAAALAGTTFPIDRNMTSDLMGFAKPYSNSLDAVSDRDFILEFLSNSKYSHDAYDTYLWRNH